MLLKIHAERFNAPNDSYLSYRSMLLSGLRQALNSAIGVKPKGLINHAFNDYSQH